MPLRQHIHYAQARIRQSEIYHRLRQSFLLRWTLANIVGWSIGLYIGTFSLSVLNHFLGLIVTCALAGMIAGIAQFVVLSDVTDINTRRWIMFSALGGALGTFPVLLVGIVFVAEWRIGFAIAGALYGLCFGWMQHFVFYDEDSDTTLLWVLANLAAGGLCGWLSFGWRPLLLPICCSPGPLLFGVVTGAALVTLLRQQNENP